MHKKIVIVGSGFRGMCACMRLINKPNLSIHLIDNARFFGGIMSSRQVGEYYVDNGVQMFDSIPQDLANLVNQIMDHKTAEIDFVSESAFMGKITSGFSLPDLSALDETTKNKITAELLSLAANNHTKEAPRNLLELFQMRYGATASNVFSKIFVSLYNIKPEKIDPSALAHTSLGRLKHLDDAEMLVLKSNPWLDNVLAARRKTIGKVDDYVSIYPVDGRGMRGFCERAQVWLQSKGVKISMGQSIMSIANEKIKFKIITDQEVIEADQVVWANDNVEQLSQLVRFGDQSYPVQHVSSMVLMTFVTKADAIKNFTYLQDFTPEHAISRVAAAGHYSQQYSEDGNSFITCECPVVPDGSIWLDAEAWANEVWDECKELGIVNKTAPLVSVDVLRVKKTNKLPLLGFASYVDELNEHIKRHYPGLIVRGMELFNRRQIFLDSEYLLNL